MKSAMAKMNPGDGEFNLNTMTKNYLIEIITKNPYIPTNKLAKLTGIDTKTLKGKLKKFEIEHLRK